MNSNLISLLKKIEDSELKSLMKFAKSPFLNSNKLIIELLKVILLYHPHFEHKRLTKEIIFRKIHSEGTAYNEGKMNLLMTQLVKLIERFFMYQEFESDEILQRRLKGKGFRKRGFYKEYKKEVDNIIRLLDSNSFYDENYYFQKYFLNEEIFFQIETDKLGEGQQYLKNAMENLDLFFMISKTKLSADLLTRASTHKEQLNIKFLESTLKYSNSLDANSSTLLFIYHKILHLKVNDFNDKDYQKLKIFFFNEIDNINLNDQYGIFLNLVNLNIHQFNRGHKEKLHEVFRLYQVGFLRNLILRNGQLTVRTYYNIASIAAAINEYEWSAEFINKNEKYLPKSDTFQIKSYALAILYFVMGTKKDKEYFYDTMKILRMVTGSKKNSFIIINSKSLLIRSYYELMSTDRSYNDSLESLFSNFEKQVKNNKVISQNKIDGYLSFNKYTKLLHKYRTNPKMFFNQILKLKQLIDTDKNLMLKHWVQQKLEELMTSSSSVS